MRNTIENPPGRRLKIHSVLMALTVASLALLAPLASANAQALPAQTSQSTTPMALDPLSTGSIGGTVNQARNTLENTRIDHAVANSMSSVQIPSYLSMLADRRILVLLSLIGLFVVWINRTPQSRDDSKH
jgi:hypothetical protein